MTQSSFSFDWAYAWGGPVGECRFKSQSADFIVEEILPFEPSGEGEHACLLIEKEGENTDWIAGQLARFAGVKRSAVSYAGRKDRHGITRQWFTAWMPGKEHPDWSAFGGETFKVLQATKHGKKLRTGALKGNQFIVTLRDLTGERAEVDARLKEIAEKGVPNYYGEQRFGHQGVNVDRAIGMFTGELRARKNKRSIYLSAARSWLYNRILSERVQDGSWLTYQQGDVPGFQDSGSLILRDHDEELRARIESGAVSLTVPLWGKGELLSGEVVQERESAIAAEYPELCQGLEAEGLKQERKAVRLIPADFNSQWLDDSTLQLTFTLPKGCFATAVLRELMLCREESRQEEGRQEESLDKTDNEMGVEGMAVENSAQ
ncbi:tRNA pseudouridine(13) synthase TruD [Endozoicomonas sp. OPT23]|uniref:tRNA pseudouridine(13) synthase TruD n=1 Tax=Endozoicomonas sp. OPT23 TaxID=2072845 RepID=UPI00129A24FE|nr:tRNA pseudouridine(13) synthase TruD [Endozoicomonas sp. OPT23]MRI34933.1 tRNA pseudouridine(13) synthase TruD [Endozoicomonas sp. OPT23]